MKYDVTVSQINEYFIEIEAESEEQALQKALKIFSNGKQHEYLHDSIFESDVSES